MKLTRGTRVLAFGITLAVILLLYSLRAPGQQAPPANAGPAPWWQAVAAIYTFQALNLLPAWAGLEDDWRFLVSTDNARRVVCIQDRATGMRWTTSGRLERFIAGAQYSPGVYLDLWESNDKPRPRVPAADVELCWPQAGPVSYFPRTLGEPAYRAIVHTRPDRSAPLDWQAMTAYAMGTPQAGLFCSVTRIAEPTEHPDPLVGWHPAPGGGLTRCRAVR